jgi:predicted Rossmann-fold nucleotide-binding protein
VCVRQGAKSTLVMVNVVGARFAKSSSCRKIQSMVVLCSAGTVADHSRTVAAVVEVGAKLEHAGMAVLAAAAAAAQC